MQLNGTPSLVKPSRAAYLESARAAVAAGDWAALPVLPEVLTTPEPCKGCGGKGFEPIGGQLVLCRSCMYLADTHPGFDLPRRSRPNVGAMLATFAPGGRPVEVWRLCDACTIDQFAPPPWLPHRELPALRAALPWQPDCTVCGDLGWTPATTQGTEVTR
ncbi:hypothetical protein SAMN04489713_111122 [Actinomadura madurae]|uniref:Uncharacterized protein n=1 Tax=Actinomadura madurae TaxID=1993 RepID=A0A1I5M1J5_9ACTN|nr:hypothetical protein [Actinomadura madurae]SFP03498.1 hypothetical protein SAMN04489713_111122 [Actinomadura madurae]